MEYINLKGGALMDNVICKRFCPDCENELADDTKICPSCEKTLFEIKRTPMYAALMGYLWGGLAGGIALGIVKVIEHLLGFNERMIEMIVFGVVAVSVWKVKKAQLLEPNDLANIKQFEVKEKDVPKEVVSITENNIDIIVEDLKKRQLKPSKHFTVVGLILVVIFGIAFVVLASNFASSMSTEAAVAGMAEGMEGMKNEGGPLGFIIRIAAHIVGIAKPLFPILIPFIWTMLFVFIAGTLLSIITYLTNFRNKKILLGILTAQASIGGVLFAINHFSNIIDKDWTFWVTIVVVPLSFILFYLSIGYAITSLFNYCTTCGGKLSKNLEVTISNKNELALLKLLKNNTVELLDQIEHIDPDEIKGHLKIRTEMCPKDDHGDCKITVSRVQENKLEKSNETTISTVLWFDTVVPFELGNAITYQNSPEKTNA